MAGLFAKKPWYKSKTIVGAAVASILALLDTFGIEALAGEKSALVEFVMGLGEAVGALVAIYGRVTAKSELTK